MVIFMPQTTPVTSSGNFVDKELKIHLAAQRRCLARRSSGGRASLRGEICCESVVYQPPAVWLRFAAEVL